MKSVFSDSFLKETIYLVLFAFVVLKLGLFSFESVVNGILLFAFLFLTIKLLKSFKRQKAVLFDFGGVVAEGNYFTEPIRIRKGMPELVHNLKKKNYKVALLTNQNLDVHNFLNKKYGLQKLFSEQIVSGQIGVKKPHPEIYKHALNKLKVKPQDAFFVDDKAENVAGAKKLGINGILFQSVQQVSKSID